MDQSKMKNNYNEEMSRRPFSTLLCVPLLITSHYNTLYLLKIRLKINNFRLILLAQ